MQQKLFDCMLKQSDFGLKSGDENAVLKPDLKVQTNFISEFSINQTLRQRRSGKLFAKDAKVNLFASAVDTVEINAGSSQESFKGLFGPTLGADNLEKNKTKIGKL
jgi:hypothetical protein